MALIWHHRGTPTRDSHDLSSHQPSQPHREWEFVSFVTIIFMNFWILYVPCIYKSENWLWIVCAILSFLHGDYNSFIIVLWVQLDDAFIHFLLGVNAVKVIELILCMVTSIHVLPLFLVLNKGLWPHKGVKLIHSLPTICTSIVVWFFGCIGAILCQCIWPWYESENSVLR